MNISPQFGFRLTTELTAAIVGASAPLGLRLATETHRDSNSQPIIIVRNFHILY